MPKVSFIPDQVSVEVDNNTKLLVAARRAKADIRFGCASCKCGTCAVKILPESNGQLSEMPEDEQNMLKKLRLDGSGDVRMACRAKVLSGDIEIDLSFQNEYDIPDEFEE